MRKLIIMMATVFILFASIQITAAEASEATAWLNTTELNKGVIGVEYTVNAKVKTKVMISKGTAKYTYNLTASKKVEQFPLQLGNGNYTITLLENKAGNQYNIVKKAEVKLDLKDSKVVFLNSVQNITWTSKSSAIVKAKELTANKKTDTEKVKAIYDYIVANINYDYELAANVTTDYLPSIDLTLTTKKGICYGYATLFAAMLRSLDIPTKLVMGDTSYVKSYHAWNEVLLNGKWVTIDTTVDAGLKKGNQKFELVKDVAQYKATKEY